jgi:hypothetical protein
MISKKYQRPAEGASRLRLDNTSGWLGFYRQILGHRRHCPSQGVGINALFSWKNANGL